MVNVWTWRDFWTKLFTFMIKHIIIRMRSIMIIFMIARIFAKMSKWGMVNDSIMNIFWHLSTNPVNVISNRFQSGTTTTTSTTRTTRTTTTGTTSTTSTTTWPTTSSTPWPTTTYYDDDEGKKITKELPKTDHMSDQRAAINQNYQFFGWGAKNYNDETGTNKVVVQNS